MGRTASGVRGIKLDSDKKDEVVGMLTLHNGNETILVVSENGYGKRSEIESYRITNRGGKGVKTLNVTEKTGYLIALKSVAESDDLMIINQSGITIRLKVSNLRVIGRAAQGVKVINLNENDQIAAVANISEMEEEEQVNEFDESNEPIADEDSLNNNNEETQEGDNQIEDADNE
jgi:DNA gyrase subunit A